MANVPPPDEPTDEQRAAAFRSELAGASRHGGRALRLTVPPRAVLLVVAAFLVLGVGGTVLEHVIGNGGSPATTTTPTASTTTAPGPRRPTLLGFIGLKEIASAQAPPVALVDQRGEAWRLSDQRGHVTLLTFYSSGCTDICPVLGAELREALGLLGARHVAVDVAVVNTDPRHLRVRAAPAALTVPGIAGRADVQFLTGSLSELDAVWSSYGVRIRVATTSAAIEHNDVLYFVDPRGRLRALALPFADANSSPASLGADAVRRFAQGIADEASSLAR